MLPDSMPMTATDRGGRAGGELDGTGIRGLARSPLFRETESFIAHSVGDSILRGWWVTRRFMGMGSVIRIGRSITTSAPTIIAGEVQRISTATTTHTESIAGLDPPCTDSALGRA